MGPDLDLNQIVAERECRAVLEGAFAALEARGMDAIVVDPSAASNSWVLQPAQVRFKRNERQLAPPSSVETTPTPVVVVADPSTGGRPKNAKRPRGTLAGLPGYDRLTTKQKYAFAWRRKKNPGLSVSEFLRTYTPRRK